MVSRVGFSHLISLKEEGWSRSTTPLLAALFRRQRADVARPWWLCSVTLVAFPVCVWEHTDWGIALLLQATIERVHGTAMHARFGLSPAKYLPSLFEAPRGFYSPTSNNLPLTSEDLLFPLKYKGESKNFKCLFFYSHLWIRINRKAYFLMGEKEISMHCSSKRMTQKMSLRFWCDYGALFYII